MLKVYRSCIAETDASAAPGQILDADRRLIVGTRHGALELLELQQEGKRKLPAEEFLRGYRLSQGEVFAS